MIARCSNVKFVGLLVLWHGVIPELRTLRNSHAKCLLHIASTNFFMKGFRPHCCRLPIPWGTNCLVGTSVFHFLQSCMGLHLTEKKNMHYADAELFGIA